METESGGMESAEGSTDPQRGAMPIAPSIWRRLLTAAFHPRQGLWDTLILLLAAVLRLASLSLKPPHFDEGVNGYFIDEMTRTGFYHYDPTNFHGPFHFYVLFLMQSLFGREVWALRLPLVLASIACVVMLLFCFRRYISVRASRIAALAMAVSPGFVFYGRYAIHETWLALSLIAFVAGAAGVWSTGRRRDLWLAAAGFAGMLLTKETWVIHIAALFLAAGTLWLVERFSPSAEWPRSGPKYNLNDLTTTVAVGAAVVAFFYSGCLLDPSGLGGFFMAFAKWTHTGAAGESGHEKDWWYWLQLLGEYEWPALLGAIASCVVILPRVNRFIRWVAIASLGTLVAYSIVPYKTPWCLISFIWPFFLVFGVAVEWVGQRIDRWTIGALATLVCAVSFAKCWTLNFVNYTDEREPYVYVQSTPDVLKVVEPLRWLARRDPDVRFRPGHVIEGEHHPLIWLLGDWPEITWGDREAAPEPLEVDWLLVATESSGRIEQGLSQSYFRERLHLRGMAPDECFLYLRAAVFADHFPGREPEFRPSMRLKIEKGPTPE